MSLRYTGEATMDEPALRDVERWKDKIEVRLDNRQVFFLFFGSAMVACMLFVLGVIVGKRLESRGRAEAPVIEDPLAALDRFSAPVAAGPAGTGLAFPRALLNNTPVKGDHLGAKATLTATLPAAPTRKATAPVVAARETSTKKVALVEAQAPTKKEAPAVIAVAPATKKTALLPHPLPPAQTAPVATKTPAPGAASAKVAVPSAKAVASTASKPPTVTAKTPVPPVHATAAKGAFMLQLSSFQDRADADAFAHRFSGQNAYVVASEVPGKGLWYRVRVGSYGTLKDATVAKTAFEHDHGVIAYVAGSGPAQ